VNYRLVFNGPIKATPGNALRARVANILEQADFESLTVIVSSEGGDTREGLSLYNFFRSLPQPVRMHAAGHVDSMAVPVFLAGAVRTCSPAVERLRQVGGGHPAPGRGVGPGGDGRGAEPRGGIAVEHCAVDGDLVALRRRPAADQRSKCRLGDTIVA